MRCGPSVRRKTETGAAHGAVRQAGGPREGARRYGRKRTERHPDRPGGVRRHARCGERPGRDRGDGRPGRGGARRERAVPRRDPGGRDRRGRGPASRRTAQSRGRGLHQPGQWRGTPHRHPLAGAYRRGGSGRLSLSRGRHPPARGRVRQRQRPVRGYRPACRRCGSAARAGAGALRFQRPARAGQHAHARSGGHGFAPGGRGGILRPLSRRGGAGTSGRGRCRP